MNKTIIALTLAIIFTGQASASTPAEIERKTKELEALDSITSINQQNLLFFETAELFKEKFMENREGKVNITAELQEAYQDAKSALDRMIKNTKKCTNPATFSLDCNDIRDGARVKVATYLRIAPPPVGARSKAIGGAPPAPAKETLEAARAAKESSEAINIEMPQNPHEERMAKRKALTAQVKSLKPVDPALAARTRELLAARKAAKVQQSQQAQ